MSIRKRNILFKEHDKFKYVSEKNDKKILNLTISSTEKIIFECNKCNHDFISSPCLVNRNVWCPYCANQKLCSSENCKICYNKSFASHEKSKLWSGKNILLPRQIFKKTSKKYIFNCESCNHEYDFCLNSNKGCPYCSNPPKLLCGKEDCKKCFDKSFASETKSKQWSKLNKMLPINIFKSSNKKFYFDCNICKHNFQISPNKIVHLKRWCPFCSHQKLCDNNNCSYCFKNSFASNKKSKYWSAKNTLKPRQVFKKTAKIYIFFCKKCNKEFKKKLSEIDSWCSDCNKKLGATEKKMFSELKHVYPTIFEQFKVEWCKNIMYLPFDFVIEDIKIIIELDGPQHFRQVSNWESPEHYRERDIYKMKKANENNFSVIRILQKDVWNNKYDWVNEIINSVDKLKKNKIVQNIFICKNEEYCEHIKLLEI